jgi:CheY-like chemotaxis protein
MNILIIEDEPLIRKSLSKLLKARGANVTEESSGKKALMHIRDNEYDRIVCDLMLTDITGFDIIEGSKAYYPIDLISTIFIIITAYSSEQVLERAQSYRCKLIQKPFNDLKEVINTIMGEPNES